MFLNLQNSGHNENVALGKEADGFSCWKSSWKHVNSHMFHIENHLLKIQDSQMC